MRPMLYSILVLGLLSFLASCQTLSKEECTAADWRVIGEQDGAAGHDPQKRFAAHAKACEKANVVANQTLWNDGYQQGLVRFCTPLSGLAHGQKGAGYANNCPAHKDQLFRSGYDLGLTQFRKQSEINSLKSRISSAELSISSLERRIGEGKVDQREAEFKIRDQRRTINELNREVGRKEFELAAINREIEDYRYSQQNSFTTQ